MLSRNQILDLEKKEGKKLLDLRRKYNIDLRAGGKKKKKRKSSGKKKKKRKSSGKKKKKCVPGKNNKFAKMVNGKCIRFGDPNMTIKKHKPGRKKSFCARHQCSKKNNPQTPGYQSCKKWNCKTGKVRGGGKSPKSHLRGGACWPGYERVPGTAEGAKGSCRKKGTGKTKRKRKTVSSRRKRGGSSKRKRRGSSKRKRRGSSKRKRRGSSKRKRGGSKRKKKS